MRTKLALSCIVAIAGLFIAPSLRAQTTTTLFGTITDRSGAVFPNAQVTATNVRTNQSRTAVTNSEGQYRIEFLPIGEYTVAMSATGFKKLVQKGVVLEVNVTTRVDATLDVGTLTEEISIAGAAPLVNTADAQ